MMINPIETVDFAIARLALNLNLVLTQVRNVKQFGVWVGWRPKLYKDLQLAVMVDSVLRVLLRG